MPSFSFDFSCFKKLRGEMHSINYNMYPFVFEYNSIKTFVAAYTITNEERSENPRLKYVLFHLIFMKQDHLDKTVECDINANGVCDYDKKNFRSFFDIKYDPETYGNFMRGLCKELVRCCPPHAVEITDKALVKVERHVLCRKLKLDPEHCYRLSIIRLGKDQDGNQKYRNPNKYQLALKLFPNAAHMYAKDRTVTYGFTDDPDKEVEEKVAIARFIERERKNVVF